MNHRSPSPRSASPRGRPSSPRPPPSYARSSLDRSPSVNPMVLDDRPRVPPPIYLRSSSPQAHSGKGSLKIHVAAWGVALVRPPRNRDLHPLEAGGVEREPPCEDTVLSGALEVNMKERRRVQAISVGVQSVCRLHMGEKRGWEEDGVFERGVEVLASESDEGIWLEKGSQSFSFSILLPATLATTDFHNFGRVSYILTARVEGIPSSTSFTSMFKVTSPPMLDPAIPNRGDFERVIARSDKLAASPQTLAHHGLSGGGGGSGSRESLLGLNGLSINDSSDIEDPSASATAIAVGEGSPSLRGLYTRRQSCDLGPNIPPLSLNPPAPAHGQSQSQSQSPGLGLNSPLPQSPDVTDAHSKPKSRSPSISLRFDKSPPAPGYGSGSGSGSPVQGMNSGSPKSEKSGWLKGDLIASRAMIVHANPSRGGGVTQLDLRKEGFVDGLGTWRFTATADVFSISSVILLSIACPSPSPLCTIFLSRLVLVQGYNLTSPRTPNMSPHQPEAPKHHVLYQVGRPHRPGEKCPAREVDALWRGTEAGGRGCTEEGWKIRAVARMPNHDKVRPTTCDGTITPIRVSHEFTLQIFYSVDGQCVRGEPIDGPGELRMMSVKVPIAVPSCVLLGGALDLPTYETAHQSPKENIDAILSSPPSKSQCMCGSTFAELGEAAMRRLQVAEQDEMEGRMRESAGGPETDRQGQAAGGKEVEARRESGVD